MCKHLYAVFLFLLAFLPAGGWAAGGIDFHPIEGQTYVIMNAETGEFLYYAAGKEVFGKSTYYPFMTINDNIPKPTSFDGDQRWEKLSDLKDASVLLWGFEKSGIGDFSYRLYNKGTKSNQYVMKTTGKKYDYYYFTDNQSDATPLYFIRSPYNVGGYMVSASPDFKKNMWYISYSEEGKDGYFVYDSGTAPLSLLSVSKTTTKDPGKDLSSFRFLTYDDLWNMYTQLKNNSTSGKSLHGGGATLSSRSYVEADKRQASNYVELIQAIRTFADAKRYKPLYSDQKGANRQTAITNAIGSPLVIKSRRFGTYLARKRNGSIYLSKSINKDCAWALVSTLDKDGKDCYALMSMSNLDNTTNPYLTIGGADEEHAYIDFAAASDCNPKYCSLVSNDHTTKLISFYPGTVPVPTTNNGYGQYEENITTSSTSTNNYVDNLPTDWVTCSDWKLIRYDETNNEHVSLTDDQLYSLVSNVTTSTTKIPFFRIENVAYSQMNRGAGWISDVDHRDELGSNRFLACKDDENVQPVLTNMPLIDITSTTESKAWAPNLWRFELVRKGTGNPKDMPIGIVSATPHNLYKIKNANSGKYVCWPNNNGSLTAGYFTLKKDPTEAQIAYFWLDDLGNGEYALALRNPTNNTHLTYSDGDPVGYAVIKSSNYVKLTKGNTQVSFDIGPYTAGLYLETSTTVPTAESTGAFSIEQAFTIEAFTGDDNDAGIPTRRYVTAYYPFAIAPADPDVSLYTVHWSRADHSHVGFTKVDYLPANTGGIAFAPYKNDGSEVFTFRLNPDVNSSDQPTSLLTGVTEAENLWFSQGALGNETYTSDTTDPRYNYLVFSSWAYGNGHTTDGQGTTLGLFAPVDAYPMTNRCFIDVSGDDTYKKLLPQKASAKGALVNLDYDEVPTYLNRVLQPHAVTDDAWYDLQGHKTWFPTHGIFIHKGRKVLIK